MRTERARPSVVYLLVVAVGVGAFLYPFWLPADRLGAVAHSGDAPLLAAAVGALVVGAMLLEVRRGTMNGALVAVMAVLAAAGGLLRLLDLPGGGSGIFFLIVLAGAAFGARFGVLLGATAMAVSALVTGGVGPWLPFQMLTLAWMGGSAGALGRVTARLPSAAEVALLAAFGWVWGFVYGAVMNLWFWPFAVGSGPLAWHPGLSVGQTLAHYRAFYMATSFAWDAAGAVANAVLIALTGRAVLRSLRRVAVRLEPVVELDPLTVAQGPAAAQAAMRLSM